MKPTTSAPTRIKLQLDYKTIIILNKRSSVKIWTKRYPNAVVLNSLATTA